jgi:biopolymer transport protein ExbD
VTVTIPLSFRKDQRVLVGKDVVALEFVGVRVKQALAGQLEQGVILAADGSLTFDETVRVFGELVGGGVTRVAIQVQPVAGRQ